jgi:transcriptional regulator with XRE-family HTH domain
MRLDAYLKLTQKSATEIATRCDVCVSTITRVAKGTKDPSLKLIERIRNVTAGAVTADDFLPPFDPAVTAHAE